MIREEIYSYIQNSKKPVSVFEISDYLKREKNLKSKNIVPVLQELESEGMIIQTRKNKYATPEQLNLIVGTIRKNAKGFGFLVCDNESEEDVFIPGSRLRGALHMDHVVVRLFHDEALPSRDEGRHREGEVIRIIERYKDEFVGTFYKKKGYQFVVPDDPLFPGNIRVNVDKKVKIKSHDKVMVKVKSWPEYSSRSAKGKITRILGNKDEVGMDVRSLIYQHGLDETFPDEVRKATKNFSKKISPQERDRRIDYRHLPIVTIDGADSKDLDDGVHLEKTPEGFCLSVHIADVGHYVPERSVLDQEAFKRGTSVYLVDRVLPMLPPILSNDLCSLNSGEDRLALTCVMLIDFSGNIISHSIEESIINVRHRLTYEDVNDILLRDDPVLSEKYRDILPMLREMAELQGILNKKRLQHGSIDFNIPESKIILDEQGKPVEIRFRKRELAERIIEEFMIAANITVAKHFKELEIPFIYRVHENPDSEKIDFIAGYLQLNGINLLTNHEEIKATDYQAILKNIEETEIAYPVSVMLLRSMKHAYYSTNCIGHFGLGLLEYTHFTSPIRRYSDLAIHRVIKEYLRERSISVKRQKKLESVLKKYAEQASHKEIGAEEIERNSVSMKKAEFMADKVGEVYPARIVSVVGFGFFVQLENSVEGLVHISTLVDDFYGFDENQLRLIGENTNRQFKIGDMVQVKLVNVNISETKIDFELYDENGE